MKLYQYHDVNLRGTITRVTYKTTNKDGQIRDKYANIYLPYGYDANNKQKKYNILYLMHGGGGSPDAWLDCCKIKNMLDFEFESKNVEPFIVVFPTFYKEQINRIAGKVDTAAEAFNVRFFQKEVPCELLPAVEGAVNGYAADVSPEGLMAARDHRAFGGFSMGSCTTWYVLMDNPKYFSYYLPLSGDCWIHGVRGGADHPEETAKSIYDAVIAAGLKAEDIKIFAATGTKDPACGAMAPQIEAMKKLSDLFIFDEDPAKGNFHFLLLEDGVHAYETVYDYVYNYLPYLFK